MPHLHGEKGGCINLLASERGRLLLLYSPLKVVADVVGRVLEVVRKIQL